MSRRTILTSLLAIAAVTGLVFAWPILAGTVRERRIGNWVPDADPGTQFRLVRDGHSVMLSLGELYQAIDLDGTPSASFTSYESYLYPERDQKWGHEGEPGSDHLQIRYGVPQRSDKASASGGYRDGNWLHAIVKQTDGGVADLILAGPPDLQPGATTPWQPLAIARELGIVVEWEQTPTHVRIRCGPPPSKPFPRWDDGVFRAHDAIASFAADGPYQVASILRAQVPDLAPGIAHVRVELRVLDGRISPEVTLR